MKILLLGEYSNVHCTLAQGLRALGHHVDVASDGDSWKNYPRDIDLRRQSLGRWDTLKFLWRLRRTWPRLQGYDVVQLINPVFIPLRAERILPYYRQLRERNGKLFLGAFGVDKPWVEQGLRPETFRYSDFYLYGKLRENAENEEMIRDWLHGPKGELNEIIAEDCDGIVAGLYEYWCCYQADYAQKTTFIPFPVNHDVVTPRRPHPDDPAMRFFIGVQRARSAYKGTDIMLRALDKLQKKWGERMQIIKAESVPFAQYSRMMDGSDVLLDQLYSYTPAMNGLLAMAKGLVLVGGGEEEQYELLGEKELRPIINVQPTQESVEQEIERRLLLHPDDLAQLQHDSRAYTLRHHHHIRVAEQYVRFWEGKDPFLSPLKGEDFVPSCPLGLA